MTATRAITARTLPPLIVLLVIGGQSLAASQASSASAPASGPAAVEKLDLFTARAGGYATYRIPGIVVTTRGTLLAYCEARRNGIGDWDHIDVLMRRSTDGGRTWDEPRRIAGDGEQTTNNPVAVVDRDGGAVHFLHCVNYARCFYLRSGDDGKSFGEPVEITATFDAFKKDYDWNVIATGPGHGIQLQRGPHAGRLLVPVWLSTGGHRHRPSCVSTIYSDDHGKTWRRGDIVASNSTETPNPNETVAVQLDDGRVMLNIRNESPKNRRLIATSADGATGWTAPAYDEHLFEPVCFAGLTRAAGRDDGKGALVWSNPDSADAAGAGKGVSKPRRNLTIRLSEDDGQSWPAAKVLDPGIAGYSDLAAGPDGGVYCLYERGGLKGQMFDTATLCLARFELSWIKSGAASAAEKK